MRPRRWARAFYAPISGSCSFDTRVQYSYFCDSWGAHKLTLMNAISVPATVPTAPSQERVAKFNTNLRAGDTAEHVMRERVPAQPHVPARLSRDETNPATALVLIGYQARFLSPRPTIPSQRSLHNVSYQCQVHGVNPLPRRKTLPAIFQHTGTKQMSRLRKKRVCHIP
jgi:hypothetical protein